MTKKSFDQLGLSPDILEAVTRLGYTEPTPIQSQTIPLLIEGKHLVGQSQTGSGKTAAFCLPAIEKIDDKLKAPQLLVLCPTRELAVQVCEESGKLSHGVRGIRHVAVYGGTSYRPQLDALRRGTQIVVGTPGRLLDLLRKGALRLDNIAMVVLDEADRMLDMGFRDEIEGVLDQLPDTCQRVFFSATMPPLVRSMIDRFCPEAITVKVESGQLSVDTVDQVYFEVRPQSRIESLCRLVRFHDIHLGIIFCNTKVEVDKFADDLVGRGFSADRLHGDLSQQQRDRVMRGFRSGNIELLVATDIAARGLDVDNVEAVFNMELPRDLDDYIHRIGRTGRAGKSGVAYSLVSPRGINRIRRVRNLTGAPIERQHVPSIDEIKSKQMDKFFTHLKDRIDKDELQCSEDMLDRLLELGCEPESIVRALLDEALKAQGSEGIGSQIYEDDRKARSRRHEAMPNSAMRRLFVNAGKKMDIRPGDIVGAVCGECGIRPEQIGEIDIYPSHLFVDVDASVAAHVSETMSGVRIKGRAVQVEDAGESKASGQRRKAPGRRYEGKPRGSYNKRPPRRRA